ncbi:MAG: tetratricopeptide repeat protein [Alphaproteobacteria bacterium]
MADIFKEVDEDLRRDNAAKVWKKYGAVIVGAAVAVVLAVAGLQMWRAYDLDQRGKLSDQFAVVLDAAARGDNVSAQEALRDLSDPTSGGYSGLAAFEDARLRADGGDIDGAIVIWDQIAETSTLGEGLQTAAVILSVLNQIDTGDAQSLRQRLEPLSAEGQAYRAAALELLALIALREGEQEAARSLYGTLADDRDAPAGARARATQMLAALKG